MIDRYGEAIEADLRAVYGVRLATLWTGELTPREALNLIHQLPRTCRFIAALADDDELAEELGEPKGGRPPPLTEWSAEVERLTLIADRLAELAVAVVNGYAKKPRRPPRPLPRPLTAHDRARRRRAQRKHAHITAQLRLAAEQGRPTMADVVADTAHRSA